MNIKILFIIIIIGCAFICFNSSNENFTLNKNIFTTNDYYNFRLNNPEIIQKEKPLGEITFDSYIYSKPIRQDIICANHTNRADCWEDNTNNCQWIHKIDSKSYCDQGFMWI